MHVSQELELEGMGLMPWRWPIVHHAVQLHGISESALDVAGTLALDRSIDISL